MSNASSTITPTSSRSGSASPKAGDLLLTTSTGDRGVPSPPLRASDEEECDEDSNEIKDNDCSKLLGERGPPTPASSRPRIPTSSSRPLPPRPPPSPPRPAITSGSSKPPVKLPHVPGPVYRPRGDDVEWKSI